MLILYGCYSNKIFYMVIFLAIKFFIPKSLFNCPYSFFSIPNAAKFALTYRDIIKSRFVKMDQLVWLHFFLFYKSIDYRVPTNGKFQYDHVSRSPFSSKLMYACLSIKYTT